MHAEGARTVVPQFSFKFQHNTRKIPTFARKRYWYDFNYITYLPVSVYCTMRSIHMYGVPYIFTCVCLLCCCSQVYEHYKGLMADSFDSSPGFRAVLDEACKSFVNAVPQASEWLARYAHCLLDKVSSRESAGGEWRCCLLVVLQEIVLVWGFVVCCAGGDSGGFCVLCFCVFFFTGVTRIDRVTSWRIVTQSCRFFWCVGLVSGGACLPRRQREHVSNLKTGALRFVRRSKARSTAGGWQRRATVLPTDSTAAVLSVLLSMTPTHPTRAIERTCTLRTVDRCRRERNQAPT